MDSVAWAPGSLADAARFIAEEMRARGSGGWMHRWDPLTQLQLVLLTGIAITRTILTIRSEAHRLLVAARNAGHPAALNVPSRNPEPGRLPRSRRPVLRRSDPSMPPRS